MSQLGLNAGGGLQTARDVWGPSLRKLKLDLTEDMYGTREESYSTTRRTLPMRSLLEELFGETTALTWFKEITKAGTPFPIHTRCDDIETMDLYIGTHMYDAVDFMWKRVGRSLTNLSVRMHK